MSTRREDYVILGINIGMKDYDDDKYEEYEEYEDPKPGKIFYLIDGMSGEYFVIGEVIKQGDQYEGIGYYELNQETNLEEMRIRVKNHVKNKFNIDDEPKLIVVTHWH